MSTRGDGPTEPENSDERDLIDAEFESMVSGLSLDESTPHTYLDDLDAIIESEKFIPPTPPKITFKTFIKGSSKAFRNWKDRKGSSDETDGDGAII